MNIPSRVRITTKISYEVVWVDTFDCPKTLAECRYTDKQIAIKKGLSLSLTEKCFIHEVTHAIDFETKLGLTHKQIYRLDSILHKFMRLNNLG